MEATACLRIALLAASALVLPETAHAELPGPVRAMLDAAIATGDEGKVRTVAEIARSTYPEDGDEITVILTTFEAEVAARRLAEVKAKEEAIRAAGLFDRWKGKGELGGFRASLNSNHSPVNWNDHIITLVGVNPCGGSRDERVTCDAHAVISEQEFGVSRSRT